MAKRNESVKLKILMLGDSGVGKSSLLGQYLRQEFHENITVNFLQAVNYRQKNYSE